MKNLKKYMILFYGEDAENWKNEKDDRKLFSNIYFQIMEAIEEMEKVENIFIKVAFNNKVSEEEKVLQRIQKFFKEVK